MTAEGSEKLRVGEVFAGRYLIETLLGEGGMGAVYRVADVVLGEPIALKVLLAEAAGLGASVLRFRQEVRLARRVTHPNVARVFDLGEQDEVLFLTMELIDGVTLRQRISTEGRLDPARGLTIAHGLAEGVAAAHAVGVVHRDLKPSNVMLEKTGRVVITDFGIARAVDDPSDLTVGAIGTPSYMAPEQHAGSQATERTDLYQLGMVLHESLLALKAQKGAAIAERDLLAVGIPARAAAVITRCLELDADQRPESAGVVAREIAAGLGEFGSIPPGRRVSSPPTVTGEDATVAAPAKGPEPSATTIKSLAVMPFRARGIDIDSAGHAFTDEVLDQLSRTRGLRVFAGAATRDFSPDADPRQVALALGADLVVQGSIACQNDELKISVRLIDAKTVVQLWSDRFEAHITELIEAAETIARRVAEKLRVEILMRARQGPIVEEAIAAYFTARRRLRVPEAAALRESRDTFARCIELEPEFLAAYAGHATASLRCWFFNDDPNGELAHAAESSVERALARAPETAETHLASAVHAVHHGAWPAARLGLERALTIAPMYAEAHEYLGMLEAEAGSAGDEPSHLERAIELDPTLINGRFSLARAREFAGDHEGCDAILAQAERLAPNAIGVPGCRVRFAIWRRDLEGLARHVHAYSHREGSYEMLRICGEAVLGRLQPDEAHAAFESFLARRTNPRFVSLALQHLTETHAFLGDEARALAALEAAMRAGLIDVRWLEACPMLEPLRKSGALDAILSAVRVRAAALFR